MFCLHSAHGRVGACLGLVVVVGVRRLYISVGGVGVVSVVVGSIWSVYVVLNSVVFRADAFAGQEGGEGWIFVFSALLRSVGLALLQVGRLWRA